MKRRFIVDFAVRKSKIIARERNTVSYMLIQDINYSYAIFDLIKYVQPFLRPIVTNINTTIYQYILKLLDL